ncbi:unnamed protein product [Aureobasidium mustum]|uniref:Uncharacterized protein n=1 Tax=Aureobasidium mustum TaxID=2773714 RepID=A0A9N8K7Q3_9PEZI|nr:unnamed protein product [Aureobasidium mustum]
MNWTGGKLQRNSKSKGNAVVERQKSHFAKVRSKAPNRTNPSTEGWKDTSPNRPPSPPPLKKARTQHRHSPRIQKWSTSGQRDGRRIVGDFVLPSRGTSEVQIRVGPRAFASQLDTTVASPSTRIRSHSTSPSDYSSNSMLLDGLDQRGSQARDSGDSKPYQSDQSNIITSPCEPERMRFVLSDSLEDVLRNQDDTQYPSDFATHASSAVHAVASFGNASNNTSAEDMQSNPDAAKQLRGSPVKPLPEHLNTSGPYARDSPGHNHEDFGDNDDIWLRFIEEEKTEVGQTKNDRYAAPQYKTQASPIPLPTLAVVQEEPSYPVSVRGSTPHSSCPTARPCLLETTTSKRSSGKTSKRGPSLTHDNRVWRRFVLGYDPSYAS